MSLWANTPFYVHWWMAFCCNWCTFHSNVQMRDYECKLQNIELWMIWINVNWCHLLFIAVIRLWHSVYQYFSISFYIVFAHNWFHSIEVAIFMLFMFCIRILNHVRLSYFLAFNIHMKKSSYQSYNNILCAVHFKINDFLLTCFTLWCYKSSPQ